jgi:[NiFe] hydrogenase diaphorase moiety large subunit
MLTLDRQRMREEIESTAERLGRQRSSLIPVLKTLQRRFGYISEEAIEEVAEVLGLRQSEVYSVATFYHFLSDEPLGQYVIRLCKSLSCELNEGRRVARQLENELGIEFGETTEDGLFTLEYTSCMGMCDQGPAMMVNENIYTELTPAKVSLIVADLRRGYLPPQDPDIVKHNLRQAGPLLEGADDKSAGLKKALKMTPEEVIEIVGDSGLRGRGGAGFPTGKKWTFARGAEGDVKYVVCNADEGEPGTFKDRLLLSEYLDPILDGMTIAAHAIGAEHGFLYLRGEYEFLRTHIEEALAARRESGLLGEDILGSGLNYDITVSEGAGAYVCGEESALIESLEGGRGEPRNRPPFPVVNGVYGKPTTVNNVETFLAAARIIEEGAEWFNKLGADCTTGTKVFSVSGDCCKPGIYELEWGISVDELLKLVGGEDAQAVLVGGFSGTLVPRDQFAERRICCSDTPSGGAVKIVGPQRDILETAINVMEFFVDESCGQCVPCRYGCSRLLEGLEMLRDGVCPTEYLNRLMNLGDSMYDACKCGLGQSAPNVFQAVVENYRDDLLGRLEA